MKHAKAGPPLVGKGTFQWPEKGKRNDFLTFFIGRSPAHALAPRLILLAVNMAGALEGWLRCDLLPGRREMYAPNQTRILAAVEKVNDEEAKDARK